MSVVFAFETLSPAASAVGFTSATYHVDGASVGTTAIVSVNSGSIRVRVDGGTATTTVGHQYVVGDVFLVTGVENMTDFSCISDDGGTAELAVSYSR